MSQGCSPTYINKMVTIKQIKDTREVRIIISHVMIVLKILRQFIRVHPLGYHKEIFQYGRKRNNEKEIMYAKRVKFFYHLKMASH